MLSSFRFLIQVVNSYQYNLTRFSTKIIEVKELYFEEKNHTDPRLWAQKTNEYEGSVIDELLMAWHTPCNHNI